MINKLGTLLKSTCFFIFLFPILPLYFGYKILFPSSKPTSGLFTIKSPIEKLLALLLVFFIQIPLWIVLYILLGTIISDRLGLIEEPIPISGTGSMYPTFPKGVGEDPLKLSKQIVQTSGMLRYPNGINIMGTRYFSHSLAYNDIVVFENKKADAITEKKYGKSSGLVKRIVGLAGDTLEIRNGQLVRNNIILNEPYIAQARSTFGGKSIAECSPFTIPDKMAVVLGDNRKVSNDSRHDLGPIYISDIQFVLPYEKQLGVLDKNWRNTDLDNNDTAKITLNTQIFLELLNKKRTEKSILPLKYVSLLEKSADLRGKTILDTNDFSTEATKSGVRMESALNIVGYKNIVWGETVMQGYFEASELVENLFEFKDNEKFLLDPDYQDIGIGQVEGEINGCPTKVIVFHLGGYIPPNYSNEILQSWTNALHDINTVMPSWLKLKEYPDFYNKHMQDIDRILQILQQRKTSITNIVDKMKQNIWLTDDESNYLKYDANLANEQNSIAVRLNNFLTSRD